MQLIVVDTPFDTGSVVAGLVGDHRPRVLGVATGSSPEPAYRELVRRGELASTTVLCLLDEYIGLAPGSAHRYRAQIERQLGGPMGALRIEAPDVDRADLPSAAAAYEQAIEDLGGVDVQILGVGRNGHIGFNEPGTSFSSRTHVTTLAVETRHDNARFFGSLAAVPTYSITQGPRTIMRAHTIVLVAAGSAKAVAVESLFTRPPSIDLPASVLQFHREVIVVADRAACRLLEGLPPHPVHATQERS